MICVGQQLTYIYNIERQICLDNDSNFDTIFPAIMAVASACLMDSLKVETKLSNKSQDLVFVINSYHMLAEHGPSH